MNASMLRRGVVRAMQDHTRQAVEDERRRCVRLVEEEIRRATVLPGHDTVGHLHHLLRQIEPDYSRTMA